MRLMMAYTTSNAANGLGLVHRLGTMIAALRIALHRRRVYGQTLGELRGLSDRDLNDLGLSRSMIRQVAYEAAYGA
jgi:uncharacterized protein YjiS (DUF1127 family)